MKHPKTYKARVLINCAYGEFFVTLRGAPSCREMVTVENREGREIEEPAIVERVLRLFAFDRLQGYSMTHVTRSGKFVDLKPEMISKSPIGE